MFSLNNLINGGKTKVYFKNNDKTIEFNLEHESEGIRGRDLQFKELELKKQIELQKLAKYLQIKGPEFNELNPEPK